MKTKVAIISVYFGKFPSYFNCFKKTASFNKDYDWYIFTDQVSQIIKENNIYFIPYTLSLLNKKLSSIFNISINIEEYNRIGDVKPLYSKLFEMFLEDYDWWGWTDLDLLNGNFNKFVNDDIFNQYDVICATNDTVHQGRTSLNGPFLLSSMKNKDLFTEIENYGEMLATGNATGRYNAFNIEEKHLYDFIVKNDLKLYRGPYINGHLISIVRYGQRKLPAFWNNGEMEIQSYKEDYWDGYVDTYGCDTMTYHIPKNFNKIFNLEEDNIIAIN